MPNTTTKTETISALIDAKELAELLSVSKPSIWRWLSEGRLPEPIRLTAQCLRWRRDQVNDWIKAGCPQQRGSPQVA